MIELFGRTFNSTEILIVIFSIGCVASLISLPIIITMEMRLRKRIKKDKM